MYDLRFVTNVLTNFANLGAKVLKKIERFIIFLDESFKFIIFLCQFLLMQEKPDVLYRANATPMEMTGRS